MNQRLSSLLSVMLLTSATAFAQTDLKVDYTDRQFLGNVAAESSNPVAVHYMPISDLADLHLGYRYENGDLHLIDGANISSAWEASFSGMKRVGKVTFNGFLVYNNSSLRERRWNNTLFVSDRNPFIIADSLKSTFNPETFHLHGGAAYKPSKNLLLGLAATYLVGSSATQKDPRPEIKGMRFRLTPGVEYTFGQHAVGISGEVEWLSEEVTHTVVKTTTKQYLLLFQGLGVFETKDAVGYRRKYNGTHWGVQAQYVFNNSGDARISNFLEGGFFSEFEDATDGKNAQRYKGGRYSATGFRASERFCLRPSERTAHNFTLSGSMASSKGKWYTQRTSTDENGNIIYETINASDNLEATDMTAQLGYRFDRLTSSGLPLFQGEATLGFENSETKNKVYGAKESYSNALLNLDATRRFPLKKGVIAVGLNAGCRIKLQSSLKLSGMPETYDRIMQLYTRPAFHAEIADSWQAGASLTYSLPIRILGYGSVMEIGVDGGYISRINEDKYVGSDRLNIGARFGFVF
ncbi:MAG: hypothetical protein K2G90_09565 [Muribaculaceae bacterium]|nr:hypothetical protein [Muribaculaceae bacterium]